MIRAAIFDLDGTLVDSNELHVQAWQETFRHFGKEISLKELRRQIGKGGDQYLPEFLRGREMREFGKQAEDISNRRSPDNGRGVLRMSSRAAQTARDLTSGLSLSRDAMRLRQVTPYLCKMKQFADVRSFAVCAAQDDNVRGCARADCGKWCLSEPNPQRSVKNF